MDNFKWPVVPLCEKQLRDIREEDILENGLYRLCDIYRGGGGYDKFIQIYNKRFETNLANGQQFVVQLYGCPLSCPYCYVTKDGIRSKPVYVTTLDLLTSFIKSGAPVFHLMGGAPALYLEHWKMIGNNVDIFHSDFLCVEGIYPKKYLEDLPGLHAVSLKDRNIYTYEQWYMIRPNLDRLIECEVNFYVTFTGEAKEAKDMINSYYPELLEDSFDIPIMDYEALR